MEIKVRAALLEYAERQIESVGGKIKRVVGEEGRYIFLEVLAEAIDPILNIASATAVSEISEKQGEVNISQAYIEEYRACREEIDSLQTVVRGQGLNASPEFVWEDDIPADIKRKLVVDLRVLFEDYADKGQLRGQLFRLIVQAKVPFDDEIKVQITRAGGQIQRVRDPRDGGSYFLLEVLAEALDPILNIAASESVLRVSGERYVTEFPEPPTDGWRFYYEND